MSMEESPKETIISVVKENLALRWLSVFLALGVMAACGTALMLSKRTPTVWVVMESGKIINGAGHYFDWEAEEAGRRAVEVFYVADPEREQKLSAYFSPELVEASKKYSPKDRFISFRVMRTDRADTGITLEGALVRQGEADEMLSLTLQKADRTDRNPLGLIVTASGKVQAVVEEKKEGLSAVESTGTEKK